MYELRRGAQNQRPDSARQEGEMPQVAQAFVVPEEEEAADAAEEETPKKKPATASKEDEDEGDEPKKTAKKPGKAPKDSDQVDDDENDEDEGPKKKNGKEKKKSKTGLILGIVGGVLLLCCCGCGGVSWAFQATLKGLVGMGDAIAKDFGKDMKAIDKGKDDRFVIDKKDGEKDGVKIDDSKPAFTISAVAMSKEFVDDNKKALQKYKNKIVEITGEIIVITPDRKVISLLGVPLAPRISP